MHALAWAARRLAGCEQAGEGLGGAGIDLGSSGVRQARSLLAEGLTSAQTGIYALVSVLLVSGEKRAPKEQQGGLWRPAEP